MRETYEFVGFVFVPFFDGGFSSRYNTSSVSFSSTRVLYIIPLRREEKRREKKRRKGKGREGKGREEKRNTIHFQKIFSCSANLIFCSNARLNDWKAEVWEWKR